MYIERGSEREREREMCIINYVYTEASPRAKDSKGEAERRPCGEAES